MDVGQLSENERDLLAVLSVFVGGFTIDAAEAICPGTRAGGLPVRAMVDQLVARGALAPVARHPERLDLAPGARRLAADDLEQVTGDTTICGCHLRWACAEADAGAAGLESRDQQAWLDRLESEHDNFRAALRWGTAEPGRGGALALAAALGRFWEVRGHAKEGRRWLAGATRLNPDAPAEIRARAANSTGLLALRQGDLAGAKAAYEESLALHWQLDSRLGSAGVLHCLGNIAFQQRDLAEAERLFDESLTIGRQLDDDQVVAASLTNLGAIAEVGGHRDRARSLYDEALVAWEGRGDL
ncbi:MAG: tetratricopeptide repeat protein, partial [Acidimicrobiales bacterium]